MLNNTINYTSHPSTYADGTPIENATRSVSLESSEHVLGNFHQHRFDCHPQHGILYYLDDQSMHVDNRNLPSSPGNVQLILWADGNQWWSGKPSTTDVIMSIKNIEMYYNTTGKETTEWLEACEEAGGPSETTVCEEGKILQEDDPHLILLGDSQNIGNSSPDMTSGGNGVGFQRMIGWELLVGSILGQTMAWTFD